MTSDGELVTIISSLLIAPHRSSVNIIDVNLQSDWTEWASLWLWSRMRSWFYRPSSNLQKKKEAKVIYSLSDTVPGFQRLHGGSWVCSSSVTSNQNNSSFFFSAIKVTTKITKHPKLIETTQDYGHISTYVAPIYVVLDNVNQRNKNKRNSTVQTSSVFPPSVYDYPTYVKIDLWIGLRSCFVNRRLSALYFLMYQEKASYKLGNHWKA